MMNTRHWWETAKQFASKVLNDVISLTVAGLIFALLVWEFNADIRTYFPALAILFLVRIVWFVGKVFRQPRNVTDAPKAEPNSQ
jgi:glucose uptake protein GlcU